MPVTSDVQRVRLLIADPSSATFADDQLQAFLDVNEGFVRLAAADALEQMAGQLLTVDSDQIKVDGSKQAATLMARAAMLRQQHYTNGENEALVIVCGPRF